MRGYYPTVAGATGWTAPAAQPTEGVPQSNADVYNGPLAGRLIGGEPFAWILGIVLMLWAIGMIARHPKVPGVPGNIAVNVYNATVIGWTAIVVIVISKAIVTRFRIPGLSTVIEAA